MLSTLTNTLITASPKYPRRRRLAVRPFLLAHLLFVFGHVVLRVRCERKGGGETELGFAIGDARASEKAGNDDSARSMAHR